MLIAVIPVKDYESANKQISIAQLQADGIELRLDYLKKIDFNAITLLRSSCHLPMIFTLRKKSQGGYYPQNENQRLQNLLFLCQSHPDYLDLEFDIPKYFIKKIKLHYPYIKLICSYHNFHETPTDLTLLFQSLQNPCFDAYKIATTAKNTVDALRMLKFVHSHHKKYTLTGLCMGEDGQCTRILSPIVGSAMNYAILDDSHATAPGQLTLNELSSIYHFRKLNTRSKIYALLGDPIHLSVGHILHNQAIEFLNKNAIYIKLRATPNDLLPIIILLKSLPFFGLSITMPLKESILTRLDEIESDAQPIQAINSILRYQGKFIGFNTDGKGAMKVLSDRVDIKKQKIIIVGAGGAARAIAYEAVQHKAEVIILNRTLKKAKKLAEELGCESNDLKNLNQLKNYTILINTLPNKAYSEYRIKKIFQPNHLLPNIFAMDIVYQPMHTSFLKIAKKANCIGIPGSEMYIYQALMQIKRWFNPNKKQLDQIQKIMNHYFLRKP
jgi:3-dehydroquinate dehydratase/shikimate dehydrogenase